MEQSRGGMGKRCEESTVFSRKEDLERAFWSSLPLNVVGRIGNADIVVGIPFYNEAETLADVVKIAAEGLKTYFPERKCVVCCVGDAVGGDALSVAECVPLPAGIERVAFLLRREVSGKGWALRAIFEIARRLGADVAVLEADLHPAVGGLVEEGLSPAWIRLLLEPLGISGEKCVDFVLASFERHWLETLASDHFLRPLLLALFGVEIRDPLSGVFAVSNELLERFLERKDAWVRDVCRYGVDVWLLLQAISANTRIGEVHLGVKKHVSSPLKPSFVLREQAKVLFEHVCEALNSRQQSLGVKETRGIEVAGRAAGGKGGVVGIAGTCEKACEESICCIRTPVRLGCIPRGLVSGRCICRTPPKGTDAILHAYLTKFKQGFNKFHTLYREILSESAFSSLKSIVETLTTKEHRSIYWHTEKESQKQRGMQIEFSAKLWSEIVYDFILAFCERRFARGDILNAFIPLFLCRVASFCFGLKNLETLLSGVEDAELRGRILCDEACRRLEEEEEAFLMAKSQFIAEFKKRSAAEKKGEGVPKSHPPVLPPKATYREFIPGVPLVLPHEITSQNGKTANVEEIYQRVLERFNREFEIFVHERLKVRRGATPLEVAEGVRAFLRKAEEALDELLCGDIHALEDTKKIVERIFDIFPHGETFALKPEVAKWLLERFPPANLLIKMGKTLEELEEEYDPNDILALASFSEEAGYMERIWDCLQSIARPEHFERMEIKPVVVSYKDFPALSEMKEACALCKLAGRVVVCNLPKGVGGDFPKMHFFLLIAKNVVEAERFGDVWEKFAFERKEFGRCMLNSLRGHWGREPLSAHNIFENKHQRILVERLREISRRLLHAGEKEKASILRDVADSYHLFYTFPDGKFLPCSAWTWASYSFKGGKGIPTPLSLHVERDWASREFLLEICKAVGISEEEVDEKITELMAHGLECENLAKVLFPEVSALDVFPPTPPKVPHLKKERLAGKLRRFAGNPILEPVKKHPWESKYVFNAGAIRLRGKIYILYRAYGEDCISRIGLACSEDGFTIEERLEEPIFEPEWEWEERGCEDPRLTVIGNRIYMLYTAYSRVVPQIALAEISVKDFLAARWENWRRHGLLFPNFYNKDALLFPERFGGEYVLYHRVEPSIWISYAANLKAPWQGEEHRILMGPRAGKMWDSVKIGGGAPPLKTKYGWLLIYHGVDHDFVYRLGVLLVDLKDPSLIIYRSPNPILEPETAYERGKKGCFVPNVVFTCGAVPAKDRNVLHSDDEIIVYYGAADSVLAVATATVGELLGFSQEQKRSKRC